MKSLSFHKVHKNGWLSYRLTGIPGAIYVDRRLLTADALATPPQTLSVDLEGLVEPGADATAKAAEKAQKAQEREAVKAEKASRAAEKAQSRLAKLQANADKAKAVAEAAAAKAAGATA